MAKQFDLYRRPNGILVVVIQHDMLEDLKTGVILPLMPKTKGTPDSRSLNPSVFFDGKDYVICTQFLATATLPDLGMPIGNISHMRDEIVRAQDLLFTGF
jgi:toxin CcdB